MESQDYLEKWKSNSPKAYNSLIEQHNIVGLPYPDIAKRLTAIRETFEET